MFFISKMEINILKSEQIKNWIGQLIITVYFNYDDKKLAKMSISFIGNTVLLNINNQIWLCHLHDGIFFDGN